MPEQLSLIKQLDGSYTQLHSLASRIGAFPLKLPRKYILKYSQEGDLVLDLFSGKGTTVLEALGNGRIGIGVDISPEAFLLTQAKVYPLKKSEALKLVNELEELSKWRRYSKAIRYKELFTDSQLTETARIFFHPKTFRELFIFRYITLSRLRNCAPRSAERKALQFILACLIGILHGRARHYLSLPCSHAYSMSPGYISRKIQEDKVRLKRGLKALYPFEYRNLYECLRQKIDLVCPSDESVEYIRSLKGRAYQDWAERFDKQNRFTNKIALVVTSPPYLGAQTYAKDNWLRLWAIGRDYRLVRRQMADLTTNNISRYVSAMDKVLQVINRVLMKDGFAFIIVGDVKDWASKDGARPINLAVEIEKRVELLSRQTVNFKLRHLGTSVETVPAGRRASNSFHSKESGTKIDRIICLRKEG